MSLVAMLTTEQQGVIYHPVLEKIQQKILKKKHGFKVSRKNKQKVDENIMSFRTLEKQKLNFKVFASSFSLSIYDYIFIENNAGLSTSRSIFMVVMFC